MAVVEHFICAVCQKPKAEARSGGITQVPTICSTCESISSHNTRTAYLEALKMLTIEERIARIEEWIYDYKPPARDLSRVPFG